MLEIRPIPETPTIAHRTEVDFPDHLTLQELIEAQVTRTPGSPAVICDHDPFFGKSVLNFAELNEKANQVARRLQASGVAAGQIVGILTERSFGMVIGLLGILKAGAAYLPLSCADPKDRIAYMVEHADVKVLLIQESTSHLIPFGAEAIAMDDPALYREPAANPTRASSSKDLAYVIYTSGSTGRPKGVMIEHRSVVNRLDWMQRAYPIGAGDVLLQKTAYTFDVSVWELFWWAITGATLCLLIPGGEKSPSALVETIAKHRVNVVHFVPSMLNVFLQSLAGRLERSASHLASLRRVFASGEALSPAHVTKFQECVGQITGCRLTNLYGPTEATVDVTYFDCPANSPCGLVPIGRPIQNIRAYILHQDRLVEGAEVGELYLAGVGLARGYLNNPELTRERFVEDSPALGERAYRTGDLARWLPDGNIEYLGREDHQVKIRGLRIELGEIENTARQFQGLIDCVVTTKKYSESIVMIIAYVVVQPELSLADLKRHLQAQLPAYMVPTHFEIIPAIPLTSSGKADRKALPEPRLGQRPTPALAPA